MLIIDHFNNKMFEFWTQFLLKSNVPEQNNIIMFILCQQNQGYNIPTHIKITKGKMESQPYLVFLWVTFPVSFLK